MRGAGEASNADSAVVALSFWGRGQWSWARRMQPICCWNCRRFYGPVRTWMRWLWALHCLFAAYAPGTLQFSAGLVLLYLETGFIDSVVLLLSSNCYCNDQIDSILIAIIWNQQTQWFWHPSNSCLALFSAYNMIDANSDPQPPTQPQWTMTSTSLTLIYLQVQAIPLVKLAVMVHSCLVPSFHRCV